MNQNTPALDEQRRLPPGSAERLSYIDLLEVLAIFFVVMYHSNISNNHESTVTYVLRGILSVCVPLFFFVNGYLLFNRGFNLKKHLRKMLRLTILTIIWGMITMLLLMVMKSEYMTLKEFFLSLWSWKQGWINHLWYMGALICIYVFYPVLKTAFDHHRDIFLYFTIICAVFTFGNQLINETVTAGSYLLGRQHEELAVNWFSMFNPFRKLYGYTFVYFCVGGLMPAAVPYIKKHQAKMNMIAAIGIAVSTICLGMWGLCCSAHSDTWWDVVWDGYDTIFTFVNVLFVFVLSLNYRGQNSCIRKVVELISVNTLGIYFIHEFFIHLTRSRIRAIPALCNLPCNLIYALLLLCVCTAVVVIMKKIPGLKRLVI